MRSQVNKLKGVIACYNDNAFFHHMKDGNLGPATNLSNESIRLIFKSTLKGKKIQFMKFKNIIPRNVLHFDSMDGSILFYTEPSFKTLYFSKSLNIPSAEYKIPFLLWKYRNRCLSVFALKRAPKSAEDKIFNAPFMNINASGGVCMGNVKYGNEENYYDLLMEDIVDKFFNSIFTHTGHDHLMEMNYMKFLKDYAGDKNISYSKLLIDNKQKIKDLL